MDDVSNWDFTNTVRNAASGLADSASQLMQPVMDQVMAAAPPVSGFGFPVSGGPPPKPETQAPEPRFDIGKPDDWLGPSAKPQQQQQPGAGDASQPWSFTLPSPSSFFVPRPNPQAAPVVAGPGSAPSPAAGAGGPAPQPGGPIDNSSRQAFVASAWPHMLAAAGGNRDAAEMMLAAAISENGDVGKGGGFIGNNFFGIKGKGPAGSVNAGTWEQTPSGPVQIRDDFAAYNTPVEGFRGFFDFLQNNSRYAPALAAFRRTGDASKLFADVNAAGYATDPQWAAKVASIRDNQVAPVTRGLSAAPPAPAPVPAAPPAPAATGGRPPLGTYTPETGRGLTVNQLTEGQAEGMSTQEALALCGPAATIAFQRAVGRNPSLREAKELAERLGLWSMDQGMAGPAAESKLLDAQGIPNRLQQGADEAAIAAEVRAGRPVVIDTPMHYYVATNYDPVTRQFDFGESANVLSRSGGRTRYRLDELPSLGMGAARSSIFLGTSP
jgi:hypothetical protein